MPSLNISCFKEQCPMPLLLE